MMNPDKLRLSAPDPDKLSPRQQEVYNQILATPRGRVVGPLALWLNNPDLAEAATELGTYLRYRNSLGPKLGELAIITTARCWDAEFEWFAHKRLALEAGLDPAIADAIRARRDPEFSDPEEEAVWRFTLEAFTNPRKQVSDATYAKTLAVLGKQRIVDLVALIGYYSFVSVTLNNFNVMPNEGETLELQD
ncbi:carboxymuconolactone decarboxylase family protein [Pseudooceanicola sp.]|uniref:carboxymuconolactone decarboxylase family protein n=1 Tax=Pseudooceanicola sp. TaxID=1914328 RepID=UPI002609D635|nr:carboxymuconolactone decarboxylase family protein [Pseudooceanicola sp.]MDF1856302.1 carboxymuconolactone decarboxylase family protein [Pseudooceanicola sp.]